MATLSQIRTQVDQKLATLWTQIQAKQDTYYASKGVYWQGLKSHQAIPADGTETLPDIGTKVPTDQNSVWPAAIRNANLPMSIQIDCYFGPAGPGYQATVWVTVAGKTYSRTAQVGPETWRTRPWAELVAL